MPTPTSTKSKTVASKTPTKKPSVSSTPTKPTNSVKKKPISLVDEDTLDDAFDGSPSDDLPSPDSSSGNPEPTESPPGSPLLESMLTNVVSSAPTSEASPTPTSDVNPIDESVTLSLPPFLDVEGLETSSPAWTIQLYKKDCLDCNRLVETATTDISKKAKCGPDVNQHCSASQTKIVFVGRRQEFVTRYLAAKELKDGNRINRILNVLNDEPESVRNYVYTKIGLM
jgi:hypothetical protein